jgi:hypothetical protein
MIERLAYSVVWYDVFDDGVAEHMTMVQTYGPFAHVQAAKNFCDRMIAKFEAENVHGQYVQYVPMTLIPECFE